MAKIGLRRGGIELTRWNLPGRFQKAASFLDYTVGIRFNNYAKQPSFYSRPGASSRNAVIILSREQKNVATNNALPPQNYT